MSTVWLMNFSAKTEWALFKNQVTTDWFMIFFWALQNGCTQPFQKNFKKNYIILVPFLGVNPYHFAEEIPRGITQDQPAGHQQCTVPTCDTHRINQLDF